MKSEVHANGLTGAADEARRQAKSEAHDNGLTGAAQEAGGQVSSEAHANGMGHAAEVMPMDARAVEPEPSVGTTGVGEQEQQPCVKRQRVDGGAAVTMPVDGMGTVLFDVARQCKEEVSCLITLSVYCRSTSEQQFIHSQQEDI